MKRYNSLFNEKNSMFYKFLVIGDSEKEYTDLLKNYLKAFNKYKNSFNYIKTEFNKPYKVGDQFRNSIYLSTNELSLNYIYNIVNPVKPIKIEKLKKDPFYDEINFTVSE